MTTSKSKQLEAMLETVIPATPAKAAAPEPENQEPKAVPKKNRGAPIAQKQPASPVREREEGANTETEAATPAFDAKWLEEERETFDCPVIVKRALARLAVDHPDLSVRGLYLKAVNEVYDLGIPYEVLRDRRRRRV